MLTFAFLTICLKEKKTNFLEIVKEIIDQPNSLVLNDFIYIYVFDSL